MNPCHIVGLPSKPNNENSFTIESQNSIVLINYI